MLVAFCATRLIGGASTNNGSPPCPTFLSACLLYVACCPPASSSPVPPARYRFHPLAWSRLEHNYNTVLHFVVLCSSMECFALLQRAAEWVDPSQKWGGEADLLATFEVTNRDGVTPRELLVQMLADAMQVSHCRRILLWLCLCLLCLCLLCVFPRLRRVTGTPVVRVTSPPTGSLVVGGVVSASAAPSSLL